MFFIGIFGVGQKRQLLREFPGIVCPACRRYSRASLSKTYSYFHFFFLPLFRWKVRYFLEFPCCGQVYEAEKDYGQALANGAALDFSRLHPVGRTGERRCPRCGRAVEGQFAFCPYCGERL